jgi:hypothetical protein
MLRDYNWLRGIVQCGNWTIFYKIYFFICGVFDYGVSNAYYAVLDGRMIVKQ